ncbi:MAG: sulfonate transport system substrate-binding protein [Hyphomicrobiales bacterium]|jgi:NitT/TauT family transport system substrate-binding protein|nr:sulfonate transport system substrate-binding protein [Hyphomicrobiales bacterium]
MKHIAVAAALLLISALAPLLAHAEVGVVKIPKGAGGVGFLPLVVMEEKKLVEQEAQKMGLKLGAEYIKFGGPSVVNDMLLSGAAHFAPAGPPAFITIWDKTAANMKVRGVAAMTSIPMYLNTNAPHLKSLKDLTANDKIAVTAVKVSIPAIIMQMAALKEFGKADYAHYDPYTVSLTHPDGVTMLLAGKSEITAHFTSPPFHQRERKDPRIRTITTSNEIMGGPSTFTMLYSPAKFYDENPKAYVAVLSALRAAIAFINADRRAAAEVYLQSEEGKGWKMDDLMEVLNDPDIRFTTSPENLMTYANFMADVGSIKNRPKAWQDMFFSDIHGVKGN